MKYMMVDRIILSRNFQYEYLVGPRCNLWLLVVHRFSS